MTNNPPSAQIKPGEYGFPLKLKARYDNFIGGEWVAPADGEYYQNLTPVTGQLLCEVASSGKRDIDLALDAAHKAAPSWGKTSVAERAQVLNRIADRIEENLEMLAEDVGDADAVTEDIFALATPAPTTAPAF